MKRKRGAPKTAADVGATAILFPEEQEKADGESEDPAVADWKAFAQDHYEVVEQLPVSMQRSFSLMRELDDLAQNNTARIVPATEAYMALRGCLAPKPRGHRRAPSGLDLLADVSAVVPPTPTPSLTNGVDVPPAIDPSPNSPANPVPIQVPPCADPPSDTFPNDTRKLLTLIATLASDAVHASSEKLGIANAVHRSVTNHLTALDSLIAQHKSTLPHPPTPTPPPSSPALAQPTSSPSIKLRTRRRSLREGPEDGDGVDEEHQAGTIPPLRLTRTPTTIRIRNKPKVKEETRQRSVSMTKNGPTNNKLPRNPPPTPRKSSNAGAGVHNRPPTNKNSNKKTTTDEVYCICGQGSFGEMIACDGEGCEREWFHLPCVKLKVAPEGNESWFCNDCAKAGIPAKKRRRR